MKVMRKPVLAVFTSVYLDNGKKDRSDKVGTSTDEGGSSFNFIHLTAG